MQTLHLRAENEVLEKIEILDNLSFNMEKKMILKGLSQEKNGETISHDDLWNDLLN